MSSHADFIEPAEEPLGSSSTVTRNTTTHIVWSTDDAPEPSSRRASTHMIVHPGPSWRSNYRTYLDPNQLRDRLQRLRRRALNRIVSSIDEGARDGKSPTSEEESSRGDRETADLAREPATNCEAPKVEGPAQLRSPQTSGSQPEGGQPETAGPLQPQCPDSTQQQSATRAEGQIVLPPNPIALPDRLSHLSIDPDKPHWFHLPLTFRKYILILACNDTPLTARWKQGYGRVVGPHSLSFPIVRKDYFDSGKGTVRWSPTAIFSVSRASIEARLDEEFLKSGSLASSEVQLIGMRNNLRHITSNQKIRLETDDVKKLKCFSLCRFERLRSFTFTLSVPVRHLIQNLVPEPKIALKVAELWTQVPGWRLQLPVKKIMAVQAKESEYGSSTALKDFVVTMTFRSQLDVHEKRHLFGDDLMALKEALTNIPRKTRHLAKNITRRFARWHKRTMKDSPLENSWNTFKKRGSSAVTAVSDAAASAAGKEMCVIPTGA